MGVACLLLCTVPAAAQDERTVTSPNGQIQFRLLIAQPDPGALFELGYQVIYRGKLLLDTSFLGFDIHNQEPILGANLGLLSSHTGSGLGYHSLVAEYMQNGSLGRRLNVEARVYNDGLAFRFIIPKSLPLDEILINDEYTEFSFPEALNPKAPLALPFVTEQPGVGWLAITEVPTPGYPRMSLVRTEPKTLATHLDRLPSDPQLAVDTHTPLTASWRVILIGPSKEQVMQSKFVDRLNP